MSTVPAVPLPGPGRSGPALAGPALAGPALAGPALAGPALAGPALSGPTWAGIAGPGRTRSGPRRSRAARLDPVRSGRPVARPSRLATVHPLPVRPHAGGRPDLGARAQVSSGARVRHAAPLRLTRRGRAVVVGLVLLVAVTVGSLLFGDASVASSGSGPRSGERAVVVLPGQTLWGIARELAPRVDPRDVVADIVERNALSTGLVQPGQVLVVPARF